MATASIPEIDWSRRADLPALALVAIGVAGVVATGVTAWAVANSPILVNRTGDVIWRSLFVAVYVAVGEYTWWRRPESPLGPLIAGLGFASDGGKTPVCWPTLHGEVRACCDRAIRLPASLPGASR